MLKRVKSGFEHSKELNPFNTTNANSACTCHMNHDEDAYDLNVMLSLVWGST